MAYREPTTRFVNTVSFSQAQRVFLDAIMPWTKEKWSGDLNSPENNRNRDGIKAKIKTDLEVIQNNYCAFCGLDLNLAHEVHREHIAPQYKHPYFIFEPENLVLSCNFCNKHKGKKLTVLVDTKVYTTTTFNILHPYRDDFNAHLSCDFANRELIFTIIGPQAVKTQRTIDCVGLNAPHLMTQRGAIIFKDSLPKVPNEDQLVKIIVAKNRRSG